jgi:O-antigen/teichoic acid export membrane protein
MDVAIFGAASRFGKFVSIPLIIVNGIMPSTISQLHALSDKNSIEKVLQTFALIAALVTTVSAIIILLYPEEILGLLFGDSYIAGRSILMVLVVGNTIGVFVGSPGVLLAMTDHQKMSMVIGVISGLLGIAISLLMVKEYGTLGVAIGISTGRVINNISIWLYCLFVLKVKSHASFKMIKYINKYLKKLV